jgi:HPt (histidine-containing phosphotransfer) domain-containing protein
MSIDMSQFYQVFFEETSEHLANMENLLLNLDVDNPSLEDLNAIFRAAHSIKGGSGTFGFTDMTGVTHVLEGLLDRLRKEELPLCAEMVDAFLAAGDVLRAQLEHHQGGPEADARDIEEICARLNQLAAGDTSSVASNVATPQSSVNVRRIALSCLFPPDVAGSPGTVDNILAALSEIAAVDMRHRPDAGDGRFEATLTSTRGDAELNAPAFQADPGYGLFDEEPATSAPTATTETAKRPGLARQPGGHRQYGTVTAANTDTSIRVSVEKVDNNLINPGRRTGHHPGHAGGSRWLSRSGRGGKASGRHRPACRAIPATCRNR